MGRVIENLLFVGNEKRKREVIGGEARVLSIQILDHSYLTTHNVENVD